MAKQEKWRDITNEFNDAQGYTLNQLRDYWRKILKPQDESNPTGYVLKRMKKDVKEAEDSIKDEAGDDIED